MGKVLSLLIKLPRVVKVLLAGGLIIICIAVAPKTSLLCLVGVTAVAVMTFAAIAAGALSMLRQKHPRPLGTHGKALGCLRCRLPSPPNAVEHGRLAQIHYPADPAAPDYKSSPFPWFREEVIREIATGYGIPVFLMNSLLRGAKQLDPPQAIKKNADGVGWPVIVFSSGIWGSCEMYTQFCRDLASAGFIVIALEHEDGSGVFAVDGATDKVIPYIPPPSDVDIRTFRQPFLEAHGKELDALAKTIKWATSANAQGMDAALADIFQSADSARMLLVGHSFGASGIVRYLRDLDARGEPSPYQGVLLFDVWIAVLFEEEFNRALQVPFGLLLSDVWAKGLVNARGCSQLVSANGSTCLASGFVRGTNHQWLSESHTFLPSWILQKIGIMGPAVHQAAYENTVRFALPVLESLLRSDNNAQSLADRLSSEVDSQIVGALSLNSKM